MTRRLRVAGAAVLGLALLTLAAAVPSSAAVRDERWVVPANWPFEPPARLNRDRRGLPAFWSDGARCAVGCRPSGAHRGWPIKPFHRQHALRAGLNELRPSSFHNGVDIQTHDSKKVYALQSGRARVIEGDGPEERVQVGSYIYWHVNLRVRDGQSVRAFRTLIGTVKKGFGHLHLSEVSGGRYLNPLRPGGRVLAPWREVAPPVLGSPRFLSDGRVLVEAFDPQTFRIRTRHNTPVLGLAALAYRVLDREGRPLSGFYWALRGTQNLAWRHHGDVYSSRTRPPYFWCWIRHVDCKPRWDYVLAGGLAPSIPDLGLPRGHYQLAAYAWDWAGNASAIRTGMRIDGASARSAGERPARVRPAKVRPDDTG